MSDFIAVKKHQNATKHASNSHFFTAHVADFGQPILPVHVSQSPRASKSDENSVRPISLIGEERGF